MAQVVGGGEINFSFAEWGSSLVSRRIASSRRWTPKLEWYAEMVTHDDLALLDFALVNGDERLHARITEAGMIPRAGVGHWRTYDTSAFRASRVDR